MSDTYQAKNDKKLEYYEWDDVWFDNAADATVKKILVIGDSISRGYRMKISELAGEKFFVDSIATSKAVDNPSFIPLIDYAMAQTQNVKAILINNGLHGFGLTEDEYADGLEKIIDYISKKYSGIKLVAVTTTGDRKYKNLNEYGENHQRIIKRNEIALKIAGEYNMTVCDLFSVTEEKTELYFEDGIHFSDEGYDLLAKKCYETIMSII